MLNLRDPKINAYPTDTGNTYGLPPFTDPLSLTTVVMNDMSTFQTGAEVPPIGKQTCLCFDNS